MRLRELREQLQNADAALGEVENGDGRQGRAGGREGGRAGG